jgi:hypothetical protein
VDFVCNVHIIFLATPPNVAWTSLPQAANGPAGDCGASIDRQRVLSSPSRPWSTSALRRRELALDAIMMAVRRRRPHRTIIHSDQGSQYGSDDWRRFCLINHLEPSTSRRGNCWDNAVAESFFSSLKKELIKKRIYKNRETAHADISEYIESFYNRTRRNSHLGGVSPRTLRPKEEGDDVFTKSWELHPGHFRTMGTSNRWRRSGHSWPALCFHH